MRDKGKNIEPVPLRAICTFYVSPAYGSEYRSGVEYLRFAVEHGFNTAIISNLEYNVSKNVLEKEFPRLNVVQIDSPITKQSTLYRHNDIVPQLIWHYRVARWLKRQPAPVQTIWIQNGALPWLPLSPYLGLSPVVVWGPVGGGEPPTPAMMKLLHAKARWREMTRSVIENTLMYLKASSIRKNNKIRLVCMARTEAAYRLISTSLGLCVPIVPEILSPVSGNVISKKVKWTPRFVWAGQNIPRKNLPLALSLFESLRTGWFPEATLDIFGCDSDDLPASERVTYHGWVNGVNWRDFAHDGVLLLTSFREGIPSVVLEAISSGLLCVSSDVGAISTLRNKSVFVMPRDEYPEYSEATLKKAAEAISAHLSSTEITVKPVDYRDELARYLRSFEIIG